MTATETVEPALEPQTAAAEELREYLRGIVPDLRARWGDDTSFPAALAWQQALAAGGWAAPSWPVSAGGRGLSVVDRVACDVEFARMDVPMLAGVLGLQNVGPALVMFGTPEQQESLPRILTGEEIWCQGFSEPGAGSDLASLRTRADAVDGGFMVNGQKVWTSAGMEATHCLLLVRTDPAAAQHQGISVLLVRMDSAGIERRPLRQLTGEAEFSEVFLTDVFVPGQSLLGPLHGGWGVTMKTLGYERSGVISMAAKLEREVTLMVEQAAVSDPVLRDELTRRWMEARLTGLLGARALAALGEVGEPGAAQSVIKTSWSLATSRLGQTTLALSGTNGLLAGDVGGLRFLRSRSATIAAGTTEVMKNILAERVLGLPKG